jgi:hypothetical protein
MPYPGAVAGRLEELLYPFRKSKKDTWETITIGAQGKEGEIKTGGDSTIVKSDGRTITCQLKVSNAANEKDLIEHINKGGAQLTGETGERPALGAVRAVYLLVQNTEAFGAYGLENWMNLTERALSQDYVSIRKGVEGRRVTADSIKAAVQVVKIDTASGRFRFNLNNGVVDRDNYKFKDAAEAKHYAFTGNRLNQHWDWLTAWYQREIIAKNEPDELARLVAATKQNGVRGGKGAYDSDLPAQPK